MAKAMKAEAAVTDELTDDQINAILMSNDDAIIDDESLNELASEMTAHEETQEMYAEEDAASGEVTLEVPAKAKAKSKGKLTKAREAKAPKISVTGLTVNEALKVRLGDDYATSELLSGIELDRLDTAPKKVKEKVVNLISHLHSGVSLSCYTDLAMKVLMKGREINVSEIKSVYYDHPYAKGTVEAQSSQMMQLLPLMGIAARVGSELIVNDESPIVQRFAK